MFLTSATTGYICFLTSFKKKTRSSLNLEYFVSTVGVGGVGFGVVVQK